VLRVLTLSTLFPNSKYLNFGGFVERQTMSLARQPGVEVQVVAPIGIPIWPLSQHPRYRPLTMLPQREAWKGLTVHRPRFPIVPLVGAQWTADLLAQALKPVLRDVQKTFPFDVIKAEYFWPDGPTAMRISRALNVPFSVTARGSDIQYWMTRPRVAPQILEAAKAAGGMLAVSAALRNVMIDHGMPSERITTHYTGVDQQLFRPRQRAEQKQKLGVTGPLILTAGALIPGKGQRLAVAALEHIPGGTLILVGDGPDKKALQRLASQLNLRSRVRLLGNVPHSEVAALMAAADVMLLPSRSEGLANVWVEALASGTPVVTCDVGGAREVVRHPETGALVPPNALLIADAVNRILANPPDQQEVRRTVSAFTWEKNSEVLFRHLSEVAQPPSSSAITQ
jgi:glycosyltransferase involved in cell wall biosynthesis